MRFSECVPGNCCVWVCLFACVYFWGQHSAWQHLWCLSQDVLCAHNVGNKGRVISDAKRLHSLVHVTWPLIPVSSHKKPEQICKCHNTKPTATTQMQRKWVSTDVDNEMDRLLMLAGYHYKIKQWFTRKEIYDSYGWGHVYLMPASFFCFDHFYFCGFCWPAHCWFCLSLV